MNGNKVILISIDGMRPDGLLACGNPYLDTLRERAYYTLDGRTVLPSVTLPCHMSLFHSVPPQRHGIVTNTYTPMVRPVSGLFEQLAYAGAVSAFFYGWEPLRDVARPGKLKFAEYIHSRAEENSDRCLTERALERIAKNKPDFVFLYMVETDEKGGHDNGWMSDAYLQRINWAIENVKSVVDACGEDYTIIITADHGGHDRDHGADCDEDTLIPMFYIGKEFPQGKQFYGGSILDIAPTVAKIMGVAAAPEWEGTSVI